MTRLIVLAAAATFSVACGGSSFDGKVKGQPLSVKDAILIQQTVLGSTVTGVILSDQTGLCDSAKKHQSHPNATSFLLLLATTDAEGKPHAAAAGSYSIVGFEGSPKSQNVGSALFAPSDASCKATNSGDVSSSGTVKLDSIDAKTGGSAHGTFDVTFRGGDTVKGNFNAAYCDLAVSDTTTTTCN